MKTYITSMLGSVAISCLVATAASCSDRQKEPAPAPKTVVETTPAPATNLAPDRALPPSTVVATPVAMAEGASIAPNVFSAASAALDHATRDQASALTPVSDNLSRSIDSEIANWKAKGGTSTTMSESKLELARTDFTQKVRTLTLADEETWRNAKTDAQSSLENLRLAYGELMSGPQRN